MEQISCSIYALESKEERSAEEEGQLQRLLLSRSELIAALKAQSAAAPRPAEPPSHDARATPLLLSTRLLIARPHLSSTRCSVNCCRSVACQRQPGERRRCFARRVRSRHSALVQRRRRPRCSKHCSSCRRRTRACRRASSTSCRPSSRPRPRSSARQLPAARSSC